MGFDNVVKISRKIHETAAIAPGAVLGRDVEIGPYAVIGPNVVIGDGTKVFAHVVIDGFTTIGKNCRFFPGCSIGAEPQDLKFKGEKTYTVLGDNVTIRECATINRATGEGNETRLGNGVLMMAYTHVAHNCIVGNNVIMSNVATLAGHVVVEDRAVIGGLAAVHQFVKVGRNAMVGGMSKIVQDIPPFVIVDGNPAHAAGLNSVGISRAGVPADVRSNLKKAYRLLYRSGLSLDEAIVSMEQELDSSEEVEHLLRFLRNVERGICRGRKD
ncbi:MAG TPA: acyl-ACP--UDP-N-acetylglucosamine O-acyltransferase [Candidatus Avacidaminococcus intestinavium]|uniref:Acyl-[acyl-carrier-protein]--UDP-N-acetylglucosamine O-acyltransferase n=1 Tax=Candidatus Avacidaminococcus intestinavium TaxID=2840684 RepID=A0A9D1SL98_9FIRM|nr:acyl-ACP--UDP-N-acetylglucosamine O-acyltransferase [Candidatus Avacidaminococcus intestinavium]